MDTFTKELEELKKSVNLAHHNQRLTQDQVSNCIRNQKNTDSLVTRLERELREMQEYTRNLEDYCIALDTAVRKHHLILTGVHEFKNESLAIICYRVLQVCYPAIDVTDIDYCYRLGSMSAQTKGRPILVKLVRECIRKEILKSRKSLTGHHETSKVFINEDLPQIVNDRRSNIKAVHENAVKKGHTSKMLGTKVTVDNITYNFSQLEELPDGLRLSDSKLVEVKGGLAFSSQYSFLSNFYPCSFNINGQQFHCSEQAYQFIRAKKLGAPEAADKVMRAKDAKECKKLSYLCTPTPEWDSEKREQMKIIVQEKFYQNENLQFKLLGTGTANLIEATTDTFWGAGVHLGSKSLNNGKWTGLNTLGQILAEVREDVKRTKGWEQSHERSCENHQSPETANPGSAANLGTQSTPRNNSALNKNPISFVPPNFNQSQSGRGNRRGGKKRGRGRGGNHMFDERSQTSIYSAHAQGNVRFPAPSQLHNQYTPAQSIAGAPLPVPSMGANLYSSQVDPQLNLSHYSGMYGNLNSLHHNPQLASSINYHGVMPASQNQQMNQSIYAQFGSNGNLPQTSNFSMYENSIYPNHPVVDSTMCINSPLPLKAGLPVTTAPSQRNQRSQSFSSSHGQSPEVMSQSHSPRLSSENALSQSGTAVPSGVDNVFLGPVASV